jgi:hypothetical protein
MNRGVSVATAFLLATSLAGAQTVYPTGTTIWDHAKTHDGYTVFLGADGFAYMIDMDGSVVNTWTSPAANTEFDTVEPLDHGHIMAFIQPKNSNGPNLSAGELDLQSNVVWHFDMPKTAPAGSSFHHDSELLANGNHMLLGLQKILYTPISPITLTDDLIIEVDPAGKVIWQWYTYQHATEFGLDTEAMQLIAAQGGDWAHTNSISEIPPNTHADPVFTPGNIIVSQRYTNTIFIIEKATGKVVWQVGPNDHLTFGQHFPHMIPLGLPGAGNILVFDNGAGTGYPLKKRAPGYSRVVEIDPETKQVVWAYDARQSGQNVRDFWSDIVSSADRLPNGNTMICQGARGRIFEIDPTGAIVWEYMSPFAEASGSHLVYRAYRKEYTWTQ